MTPWTAVCQASLSFTVFQSLLKLMPIESVMPSNQLILCHPLFSCLQSFPASESFPRSQFFASGSQNIGASASVFPMNIESWFPLGLTALIFLLSNGFSSVFSSTTVWKYPFFSSQPSFLCVCVCLRILFYFFKFYFIFKFYIIVLVLPNIKMNLPQVYMCGPSLTSIHDYW